MFVPPPILESFIQGVRSTIKKLGITRSVRGASRRAGKGMKRRKWKVQGGRW